MSTVKKDVFWAEISQFGLARAPAYFLWLEAHYIPLWWLQDIVTAPGAHTHQKLKDVLNVFVIWHI